MNFHCRLLLALAPALLLSTAFASKKDAEATALIEHAGQLSDIRSEGAPAFRLRLSFKIIKKDGSALEGQYAEVWVSKGQWQRETVVGSFRRTEVAMGRKRWLLDNGAFVPEHSDEISRLSDIDKLRPETWKPKKIADHDRNGLIVRCLEADGSSLCFNETDGTLAYDAHTISAGVHVGERTCSYSDYQKFGDHLVARSYACTEDHQPTIKARIVDLVADPTPDPGLFLQPEGAKESVNCLGAIQPPTVVSSVGPTFRRMGPLEIATVVLSVTVGTDGKPSDLKVSSTTNLELDRLALEALRQWRFKPARCDGEPVEQTIAVQIEFHSN